MKHQVLVGVLMLAVARAASADPVIDSVGTTVTKSRGVTLTVEATMSAPGEVAVTGDVNGKPVAFRKKLKAVHKVVKFTVDPKKLRLRALTTGLQFTLHVAANEKSGARATQDLSKTVPVPCIVLPGLADEQTPGAFAAFATALDVAAGGRYGVGGTIPFMTVHEYPSLTKSLALLGKDLDKVVKTTLKGTPFAKVDLVGYSYGGLVARSYLAQTGGARVRECVFLGTPNKGTPIAYLGVGLLNNNLLSGVLGQNAQLGTAVSALVNDQTKGTLRNLYPTYQWLDGNAFSVGFALAFLGDTTTPLTALNQTAPPAGVTFDAFYYSSTPLGQIGTVDHIDVANLTAGLTGGSQIDPTQIATGAGDGVVPAHSVRMDQIGFWQTVITPHDMGAGTHVSMPLDPFVLAGVATALAK